MILTDKEAESLAADVCCSVFDMRAIEAAILAKLASAELPEPATPNESGSTQCIVRWLVETPHGWIGSYEKEAISEQLRQAYAQGAAAQLDRLEKAEEDAERYRWLVDADMLSSPSVDMANAFSKYTGSALDAAIDAAMEASK